MRSFNITSSICLHSSTTLSMGTFQRYRSSEDCNTFLGHSNFQVTTSKQVARYLCSSAKRGFKFFIYSSAEIQVWYEWAIRVPLCNSSDIIEMQLDMIEILALRARTLRPWRVFLARSKHDDSLVSPQDMSNTEEDEIFCYDPFRNVLPISIISRRILFRTLFQENLNQTSLFTDLWDSSVGNSDIESMIRLFNTFCLSHIFGILFYIINVQLRWHYLETLAIVSEMQFMTLFASLFSNNGSRLMISPLVSIVRNTKDLKNRSVLTRIGALAVHGFMFTSSSLLVLLATILRRLEDFSFPSLPFSSMSLR